MSLTHRIKKKFKMWLNVDSNILGYELGHYSNS